MLLADGGISPAQGRDRTGPTATIRSAARLDQLEASNGALLNIKLHPGAVGGKAGTETLISLIETYFTLGGQHIQFNVIGSDILKDAQYIPKITRTFWCASPDSVSFSPPLIKCFKTILSSGPSTPFRNQYGPIAIPMERYDNRAVSVCLFDPFSLFCGRLYFVYQAVADFFVVLVYDV